MEVELTRTSGYEKVTLPSDRLGTRRWIAGRPEQGSNGRRSAADSGELPIFSAASLTPRFKEMAVQIEQANPGTKLTFNFAGSPTLRTSWPRSALTSSPRPTEPNMEGAEKDGTITGQPLILRPKRAGGNCSRH